MIKFWKPKKLENQIYTYRDGGGEEFLTKDQFIERMIKAQKEKARNFLNDGHKHNTRIATADFFMGRWHL